MRRSRVALLGPLLGMHLLSGCVPNAFHCQTASQCQLGGDSGQCEADGYCSLPDSSCPSKRRYRYASAELDGQCVSTNMSLPCPAGALFCDDFESGDLSKWKTFASPSGTLAATQARAHRGSYALEATIGANTSNDSHAVVWSFPRRTTGTLALRAYIADVTPIDGYFNGPLNFSAPGGEIYVAAVSANGRWIVSESDGISTVDHQGATKAARSDWYCLELVLTYPGPGAGRVQLFVDDVSVVDAPTFDPAPSYSAAVLGILRAHSSGDHRFIDDVVVADRRIGCL